MSARAPLKARNIVNIHGYRADIYNFRQYSDKKNCHDLKIAAIL